VLSRTAPKFFMITRKQPKYKKATMTKFKTLGMVLLIANAMQIFASEEEENLTFSEAQITAISGSFGVIQNVIDYLQARAPSSDSEISATYQATDTTQAELGRQIYSMQEKIQTLRSRIPGWINVNEIASINDAVVLGMAAPFRAEISADDKIPELVKTDNTLFIGYLNGMYAEQLMQKLSATEYAKNHEVEVLELAMIYTLRQAVKDPIN